MAEHSRYNVSKEEGEVLKNKLGITDQKMIEDTETLLLSDTYTHFIDLINSNKLRFNLNLLFQIHQYFLSPLYAWAGKIRTVEMSKDGVLFCASKQIKKELKVLEKVLKVNFPTSKDTKIQFCKKIALIHCELNAIHPFREGNGRSIRLMLDLLAIKKGFGMINFSKSTQVEYIEACKAGMHKEYSKMQKVIQKGLC